MRAFTSQILPSGVLLNSPMDNLKLQIACITCIALIGGCLLSSFIGLRSSVSSRNTITSPLDPPPPHDTPKDPDGLALSKHTKGADKRTRNKQHQKARLKRRREEKKQQKVTGHEEESESTTNLCILNLTMPCKTTKDTVEGEHEHVKTPSESQQDWSVEEGWTRVSAHRHIKSNGNGSVTNTRSQNVSTTLPEPDSLSSIVKSPSQSVLGDFDLTFGSIHNTSEQIGSLPPSICPDFAASTVAEVPVLPESPISYSSSSHLSNENSSQELLHLPLATHILVAAVNAGVLEWSPKRLATPGLVRLDEAADVPLPILSLTEVEDITEEPEDMQDPIVEKMDESSDEESVSEPTAEKTQIDQTMTTIDKTPVTSANGLLETEPVEREGLPEVVNLFVKATKTPASDKGTLKPVPEWATMASHRPSFIWSDEVDELE
jgi:hypothetical protein